MYRAGKECISGQVEEEKEVGGKVLQEVVVWAKVGPKGTLEAPPQRSEGPGMRFQRLEAQSLAQQRR